jgi:hypothetical protein
MSSVNHSGKIEILRNEIVDVPEGNGWGLCVVFEIGSSAPNCVISEVKEAPIGS